MVIFGLMYFDHCIILNNKSVFPRYISKTEVFLTENTKLQTIKSPSITYKVTKGDCSTLNLSNHLSSNQLFDLSFLFHLKGYDGVLFVAYCYLL